MVVKVPGIIAGACRTRGNLGPGLMIMVAMVVMVVEVVLMVMIVVVGGWWIQEPMETQTMFSAQP